MRQTQAKANQEVSDMAGTAAEEKNTLATGSPAGEAIAMTATSAYAEEWLAAEALGGGRMTLHGTVQEIRAQFDDQFASIKNMLPPPSYEVEKFDDHTSEGIAVRIYKPASLLPGSPTGLYIHSGGWTCGSIEHEDHLCRQLARDVPCTLVSVEYRLAPEHPFPAALEDCVAAYKWMVGNTLLLSSGDFFIVGGSAGGNLTLATTLRLLEENEPVHTRPRTIFALCPGVVMAQAFESVPPELKIFARAAACSDSALISKEVIRTCCGTAREVRSLYDVADRRAEAYIGSNEPANPLLSPLFHEDLARLPPIYITTSDKDPLNDEAEMLNHKLASLDVDVAIKRYPGYPHFFHALPMLNMTKTFNEDLAQAVREQCS